MDIKFAATSPRNSAENHSAAVTDEYIDGPLHRDGPSYASVVAGTSFCYFQTRAHTTDPTTDFTTEMDRRQGVIASLIRRTRPERL